MRVGIDPEYDKGVDLDEVLIDEPSNLAAYVLAMKQGEFPAPPDGVDVREHIRKVNLASDEPYFPSTPFLNPIYFDYLDLKGEKVPERYTGGVLITQANDVVYQVREIFKEHSNNTILSHSKYLMKELDVDTGFEVHSSFWPWYRKISPDSNQGNTTVSDAEMLYLMDREGVRDADSRISKLAGLEQVDWEVVFAIYSIYLLAESVFRDKVAWGEEEYEFPYKDSSGARLADASQLLMSATRSVSFARHLKFIKQNDEFKRKQKVDGKKGASKKAKRYEDLKKRFCEEFPKIRARENVTTDGHACRIFIREIYNPNYAKLGVLKEGSDKVRTLMGWRP